jgi:hypothetical protein
MKSRNTKLLHCKGAVINSVQFRYLDETVLRRGVGEVLVVVGEPEYAD